VCVSLYQTFRSMVNGFDIFDKDFSVSNFMKYRMTGYCE
jgi:hypothetical protein